MSDLIPIPIDKTYFIYVHQNKSNLKIYVGITTHIQNRWDEQRCAAFNKNHTYYHAPFYRAIRKYGWDNFSHQVIETFNDKQEALDAERYWIEFFRSNIIIYGSAYGYNQSCGGEDIATKSWEIRNNLSQRMSGDKNPIFGKPRSNEVKKKISDTKKARPLSKELKKKLSDLYKINFSDEQIKNICKDMRSQTEIAKSYCVSRTAIKRILKENGISVSPHKKEFKYISKEQLIATLKKELSVDEIAAELQISSITLYRKIKLLLGMDSVVSAKELVRDESPGDNTNN